MHWTDFDLIALRELLEVLERQHYSLRREADDCEDPDSFGVFDRCEDVVGLAFVASQTAMQAIYPRVVTNAKKHEALAKGASPSGSGVSIVQVIDASANLWKHRGEWDQPGNEARREKCLATLRAIGVDGRSDYPLSNVLHALKDQGVPDLLFLVDRIEEWRDALLASNPT